MIHALLVAGLTVATAAAAGFTIAYAIVPWRQSAVGRHLMSLSVALTLMIGHWLAIAVLGWWAPRHHVTEGISAVLIWATAVILVHQLQLLIRAQRDGSP